MMTNKWIWINQTLYWTSQRIHSYKPKQIQTHFKFNITGNKKYKKLENLNREFFNN